MSNIRKLPTWLIVLTAMIFISNLFVFGITTLLNPSFAFPDAGAAAVFPIQFFAIRHIAFAFPLLYGLVCQDRKVLAVMYSIFIIMSLLDISLLAIYDYYIPALGLIPAVGQLPYIGKIILAVVALLLPVSGSFWYLTTSHQKTQSHVA